MENNLNHNKPANPAPPLNALKTGVKKQEPVRHRSVYDEIAQRRKHEKHKIGISSTESREDISFHFGDEVSDIIDEVKQNREDDDVKVYTPDKHHLDKNIYSHKERQSVEFKEFPEDIYSDDGEETEFYDDEENYDVPPIPNPPGRIWPWVALISVLTVLCLIAAGAYGVVNGYFDGIITML